MFPQLTASAQDMMLQFEFDDFPHPGLCTIQAGRSHCCSFEEIEVLGDARMGVATGV